MGDRTVCNKIPWPGPALLGHRGCGTLAPENTLAAIDAAASLGLRAVEVDAKLTVDGTPILMHDPTLERTTTGRGLVARTHLRRILELRAGRGEDAPTVPTLEAALALCRRRGIWANVEIKPCPGREALTGRIVAEMCAHWPGVLLSSFSVRALAAAAHVAPSIPRGLLLPSPLPSWVASAVQLGLTSLHAPAGRVTGALCADAARLGLGVLAYTVNGPGQAQRLRGLGIDAIVTDRPDLLLPTCQSAPAR